MICNSDIYTDFIQKLYSYNSLSKKLIHEILADTSNTISDVLTKVKKIVSDIVKEEKKEETCISKLNIAIDDFNKLFTKKSDYWFLIEELLF